jgi:DNA helicase-2/ATP-dependent DNA helicase PcrA
LVKREHSNIFIVADDDQSIYGFRGAEPQYILDIEKQFSTCRFLLLEKNYRSSSNIVEISSKFIKKNQARFDKSHNTANARMHNPFIIQVKDDAAQLEFVIKTIKEKLSEHKNMSIAILYRNNLSSISIVDVLDRNGIGFKIQQNKLIFFKHWMVQDVLAFFKFSFDQCDYQSLLRIYYKMNRYISKTMMEYALTTEYVDSVIDGILKNNDMKSYQKRTLIELKGEFKLLAKKHPLLVLEYIEGSFRYFESVKEYCENTGQPFDYLVGLFGILRSIAQECPTIPMFLQRMDELERLLEKPRLVQEWDPVTLTTMHSSKGSEYDCVMMVDLNNQEIPGKRTLDVFEKANDCSLLEEERRLFYVGMTRAKQCLYMVNIQTVNGRKSARSIFVDEVVSCINREALDEIGEGICLYHKKFGQGIMASVLEQEKDRVILEMDFKGIRKKLDFLTCMESGLLSFKNVNAIDKKMHKEEVEC